LEGGDLVAEAMNMRAKIKQWTGIPISLGIAPTKTLAKLANRQAKKSASGVCELCDPEHIAAVLQKTPLEDIWGIASGMSRRLMGLGIHSAFALSKADLSLIRKRCGVVGERIARELNGQACLMSSDPQPKKSILSSRSFGREVEDLESLEEAIASFAARAAGKLRAQGGRAQLVTAFLETNRFHGIPYANSFTLSLVRPVCDTAALISAAKACLKEIYLPGYQYHKAGVMLSALAQSDAQLSLFSPPSRSKWERLSQLADTLNCQRGRSALFHAAEGVAKPWQNRSQMRSKRFTTQWDELAEVR
jgi:DNA polymerase V